MIIFKIFKVKGDSMYPVIKDKDKVFVSSLPYLFKTPKIGDIIVANHPHKNIKIIKRITKINDNEYFIEGDNILSSDSKEFNTINRKLILAKLIFEF